MLLLALGCFPARAQSPVTRWSSGDWWEVQLQQRPLHSVGSSEVGWSPSFRLRFQVTRTETEVRVEVTTIPENRFQERLVLRYTLAGELISAQVVDPKRVENLGAAGGFGVFGMLGREAFTLPRAPAREGRPSSQVPTSTTGTTIQTWAPGDAWWTEYRTDAGMPQRALLVDASWRHPPTDERRLQNRP
jgi:hypothetical protein